jgi:hypothetical protein
LTLLRRRRNKGLWYAQLGFALIVLAASTMMGCGGGSGSTTPKGTYQISVTGSAGSTTQTASYSLTVQ